MWTRSLYSGDSLGNCCGGLGSQDQSPLPNLVELIKTHLFRIAPTIRYAIAQDNNHGTSEAAALFVGGAWLANFGVPEAKEWAAIGRIWLEDRALRLIGPQGSFSQSSLNYHRLMLDTFCVVELWRQRNSLPTFSNSFYQRLRAATKWLMSLIEPNTGDGPNLGANDGARLLPITNADYRDYRPSVQLASVLFNKSKAYQDGHWNEVLDWLQIPIPVERSPFPESLMAEDGGFAMLRSEKVLAMLRYPRFRFRPSQADVLHVDLWIGAENILRDAGSYSYNTEDRWLNYFSGTASHNTIQFDDRDQMPRHSRFLFGIG